MPPIRVMIVDDAIVVRKALTDLLSRVPELEVAGTASNGRLALGATDYVTKPSNSDMGSTSDSIARELIPKIKALCRIRSTGEDKASGMPAPVPVVERVTLRPRSA